jgi:hypothetical protein
MGFSPLSFRWLVTAALLLCVVLAGDARVSGAGHSHLDDKKPAPLRWNPPQVDKPIDSLSQTPPCVLSDILKQTSSRATDLVANLQNFDAHEHVRYEETDETGIPDVETVARGDYDYVVDFVNKPPSLVTRETRTPIGDGSADLSNVIDRGLPSLALIFHPFLSDDYDMSCEGYGEWDGKAAWVIHFRQKKDKKPRTLALKTSTASYSVALKGRAWVAADSGEIMHLETNLVAGIGLLNLLGNAVSIDYAPVQFHSQSVTVWLPQSAVAYSDYGKKRAIIAHTFSDFKLFSVQTQQQIEKPKEAPEPPKPQ